ncbi:MAG: elongation factor P [Rickettsiaceae bacterium]|nr:elongation factor P [Rickettsiaceae bacterium]
MKISSNSVRAGNVLVHNGELYIVAKQPEHTKPGKGGAYVQIEMKNIKTGNKLNERFIAGVYLERAQLEQKEFQYLYPEDNKLIMMDLGTYEQVPMEKSLVAEEILLLADNMIVTVEFHGEEPLSIHLPATVVAEIEETDPVIKGSTATASYKPAILAGGVRVMVPPYLTTGEKIVVKTEDCSFVERAK